MPNGKYDAALLRLVQMRSTKDSTNNHLFHNNNITHPSAVRSLQNKSGKTLSNAWYGYKKYVPHLDQEWMSDWVSEKEDTTQR